MKKIKEGLFALIIIVVVIAAVLVFYRWHKSAQPDLSTPKKQVEYLLSEEFRKASLEEKKEIVREIYAQRLSEAVEKYSQLLGSAKEEYLDKFIDAVERAKKEELGKADEFLSTFFDDEKIRARAKMLDESSRALFEDFVKDLRQRMKDRGLLDEEQSDQKQ